jgi:hypothetical protein
MPLANLSKDSSQVPVDEQDGGLHSRLQANVFFTSLLGPYHGTSIVTVTEGWRMTRPFPIIKLAIPVLDGKTDMAGLNISQTSSSLGTKPWLLLLSLGLEHLQTAHMSPL